MDPVTATAQMITALATMITEIVKGQPPEVKAEFWKQHLADIKALRKFFKIED